MRAAGSRSCANRFLKKNKPILGICLGMQLLATKGFEGGEANGLGLIQAEIRHHRAEAHGQILPHVGWNDVVVEGSPLFQDIPPSSSFYFVHSYEMILQEDLIHGTTEYGVPFVSYVQKENIYGTQFHPEKSQELGLKILTRFTESATC